MRGGLQRPSGVLAVPKPEQSETYLWVPVRGATCRGPAPAGSRGTLRMHGVSEKRHSETKLGSKSIFTLRLYALYNTV